MKENIIEQPQNETILDDTINEITDSSNVTEFNNESLIENHEGSIFGKFKDAKSLLNAYNNLQAEFTRKCQQLAELKKFEENENAKEPAEEFTSVDDFVNSNMGMDKYKKEITEIISHDELSNLPNKYQVAYIIAKEVESKSANLLNDQNYLDEYILNNPLIKDKIISNYLSNLNNITPAPSIMSGNSSNVYFSPNTEPKTIKEAGELFSKMLK
ncbi:MAG: hypothetical protein IJX17_00785 [Clostridia bacterium]|nr:hypothetical protein [Clostridia bacterium]